MNNSAELPKYQCHKKVHAVKILSIGLVGEDSKQVIIPADPGYEDIPVSDEWVAKHNPKIGGYYVVYEDGYASFSPAKAFEDGYTRI